jgi:hypothetical protein
MNLDLIYRLWSSRMQKRSEFETASKSKLRRRLIFSSERGWGCFLYDEMSPDGFQRHFNPRTAYAA